MLEAPELFLGHPEKGIRPLRAADGALLGTARRSAPRSAWWWASRLVLEVREAEDEPLLFTVWRRWGLWARYDVRDADGVYVGGLNGLQFSDASGLPLGALRAHDLVGMRRWDGSLGCVLAEVHDEARGTRLRFLEGCHSPFVRMVLLTAVLMTR